MSFRWTPGCCCNPVCVRCEELPDEEKISIDGTVLATFEREVKQQSGDDCQYGYLSWYAEGLYNPPGPPEISPDPPYTPVFKGYKCGNTVRAYPYFSRRYVSVSYGYRGVITNSDIIRYCYGDPFVGNCFVGENTTHFSEGMVETVNGEDGQEQIKEYGNTGAFHPGLYENYIQYYVSGSELADATLVNRHYKWTKCKDTIYRIAKQSLWTKEFSTSSYYSPIKTVSEIAQGVDLDGELNCITMIVANITRWDTSQRRYRGFIARYYYSHQGYDTSSNVYRTVWYDPTGRYYASERDYETPENRLRILLSGSYIDDTLPEGYQTVTVDEISSIYWLITTYHEYEYVFIMNTVVNSEDKDYYVPSDGRYIGTFRNVVLKVNNNYIPVPYDEDSDTVTYRTIIHRTKNIILESGEIEAMTLDELLTPPSVPVAPWPEAASDISVDIDEYNFLYLYEFDA